jgi:multicomponent Na+:H+ antiporter subunit B
MNDSLILKTLVRTAFWGLMAVALFLYYRGHNAPGGGFIGGLVAAGAGSLAAYSLGFSKLKKYGLSKPSAWMAAGLFFAYSSAFVAVVLGKEFFTGIWTKVPVLEKVGTPMLFDLGVFCVVVGMFLQILKKLEIKKS